MKVFDVVTKKPLWVNLLVGLLLMILFLFLLSIGLGPCTRHGKNKTVPNVVGRSLEEAKKILDDNGFDVEVQDSIYTDTTAKGAVLRQIPEGDAVVKISRTVYITVNRYVPPVVEMPNFVGFSLRNIELQLKNMGLRVGDTIYVDDFARNSVKDVMYKGASITPGTKLQQGSSVVLVLGNGVGENEFVVPNLIGMTYADAKKFIESNGLSFLVVIPDPGIVDTAGSFIYWQNPPRVGEDGKRIKIRSGQTMDIKLTMTRPAIDTALTQNIPQE